jgi:hypothetical protein
MIVPEYYASLMMIFLILYRHMVFDLIIPLLWFCCKSRWRWFKSDGKKIKKSKTTTISYKSYTKCVKTKCTGSRILRRLKAPLGPQCSQPSYSDEILHQVNILQNRQVRSYVTILVLHFFCRTFVWFSKVRHDQNYYPEGFDHLALRVRDVENERIDAKILEIGMTWF